MSTIFPEGNCETCHAKTRYKCLCHKWGYDVLFFCGPVCSEEHRKDHQFMIEARVKGSSGSTTGEKVSNPQRIGLQSFANEQPTKKHAGSQKEQTPAKEKPDEDIEEDGANVVERGEKQKGERELVQNHTEGVRKRAKPAPLLAISRLSDLQKARKTNTYFKLLIENLTDMRLFKPKWRFDLKSESSSDKKINKKLMNFTSTRVEDIKPNTLASLVKRRWSTILRCIKAIEALRPDLMITLTTDKPQGTGQSKAHQYRSEQDREPILIIEEPEDEEDDLDVDVNTDNEIMDLDEALEEEDENPAEGTLNECHICKDVAKEDEVMLYCSSTKRVQKHHGCHIACMGLMKVGEKLFNEIKSHYRCPAHME